MIGQVEASPQRRETSKLGSLPLLIFRSENPVSSESVSVRQTYHRCHSTSPQLPDAYSVHSGGTLRQDDAVGQSLPQAFFGAAPLFAEGQNVSLRPGRINVGVQEMQFVSSAGGGEGRLSERRLAVAGLWKETQRTVGDARLIPGSAVARRRRAAGLELSRVVLRRSATSPGSIPPCSEELTPELP